jgi:hypothetical protein
MTDMTPEDGLETPVTDMGCRCRRMTVRITPATRATALFANLCECRCGAGVGASRPMAQRSELSGQFM